MSQGLGKAAQSIKLALAAQEEQENQMELFVGEVSAAEDDIVELEKMVNGYRTCIPLFTAAMKGGADDPIQTLGELTNTVKSIFTKLCPNIDCPLSKELSQRLFSLRAIVINLVAIAYAEDRHEILNSSEFKALLTSVIYDASLFAETQKDTTTSYSEFEIAIKGAAVLKVLTYHCDTEISKMYADGVWENVTRAFSIEKSVLPVVVRHLLVPLTSLFNSVFEREHKVHDLQIAGGNEEMFHSELMNNILRRHRFALDTLIQCVKNKEV